MREYRLVESVPSVGDYLGVRVEHDGRVVGIVRIVGDGAMFFEIVDTAAVPEHQGMGLGAMIMDSLMAFLRGNAATGAFVSLIANPGVSGFHERYGFEVRPPKLPGMSMKSQ